MIILNTIAGASAGAGLLWLTVSAVLTVHRIHNGTPGKAPPDAPKVALIRPVSGLEHGLEAALRTSFELSYPSLEIFFCVEDETDPAVPVIRRLIADHPRAAATLLIGRDRIGINPKINNVAKGWQAATADWVVIADGNAVLQADYIEGVLMRWAPGRAVVGTPMLIIDAVNMAAEVEAVLINLAHTRTSLAADTLGFEFVVGKTMLWHRDTMERIGGLAAIGADFGDDVIARKLVGDAGMTARIGRPISQRAGRRSFRQVWYRQLRWLRVSRGATSGAYMLQLLAANILPMFWVGVLAWTGALPWLAVPLFIIAWYTIELWLARAAGLPTSWRTPVALVIRDLFYIPLWIAGLLRRPVEWRGHREDKRSRGGAASAP